MQHNTIGHGYGIMREPRVTARTSAGVTGRTPMSASLGDMPHVMNADVEPGVKSYRADRPSEREIIHEVIRPEKLTWKHTHAQRVESEIAWYGDKPAHKSRAVHTTRVTHGDKTAIVEAVIMRHVERARKSFNPAGYVRREVPRDLRDIVAAMV